jgi:hypothetical protein
MKDPAEDGITTKVVQAHPAFVDVLLHVSTETASPEVDLTLLVSLI